MKRPKAGATRPRATPRPDASARSGLAGSDLAVGVLVLVVIAVAALHRVLDRGRADPLLHHLPALLAVAVGAIAIAVATAVMLVRRRGRTPTAGSATGAATVGWATRADLARLTVRAPPPDRLVLGCLGRSLVAAEPLQSLLVVGPSQSGKTTGLAIPALADWAGPVLATSVKTDLVRETIGVRRELGEVAVFDPTGVTGMQRAGWSPLSTCASWAGARKVAESLCSVARRDGGLEDASFWYASAERLIAPLLLAASLTTGSMSDVVAWLDEETIDEPILVLDLAGQREAARVYRSCAGLEDRQRSSVFSTAQSVLAAYSDPEVAASEQVTPRVGGDWLLAGGRAAGARTLYCCAPARDQSRLSPVFVALVHEVIEAAFHHASVTGRPLDPPLLVMLDEAANVAPLSDLDAVLATAAGHGVVVVTVWQDLAQIEARHGARWSTIVNNHRAKLVFPGVADPRTLELVSSLIGDVEATQRSRTVSRDGSWTESEGPWRVPVAPAGWIRRMPERSVVALYGGLPPALLTQRRRTSPGTQNRPGGRATRAVLRGHPPMS